METPDESWRTVSNYPNFAVSNHNRLFDKKYEVFYDYSENLNSYVHLIDGDKQWVLPFASLRRLIFMRKIRPIQHLPTGQVYKHTGEASKALGWSESGILRNAKRAEKGQTKRITFIFADIPVFALPKELVYAGTS